MLMSGDPQRIRGRKYHRSFSSTFDVTADEETLPAETPVRSRQTPKGRAGPAQANWGSPEVTWGG